MYFDFFVAEDWRYLPSLSVRTIYKLYTDKAYNIDHHLIDAEKYILFYTMSGHGEITVDERRYPVSANDLIFANATHSLRYHCQGESWNFWLVEFKTERLFFDANRVYQRPFRMVYHTEFQHMLERLKAGDPFSCAAHFQTICCDLFQFHVRPLAEDNRLFTQCLAYMEDHLTHFTVEGLCQGMDISRRTMTNLFVRTAGAPPYQYYQRLRAERSKEYLENTDMTMAQISATLGYQSSGHFSRIFRQQFQKTPGQYRRDFLLHT